MQTFTAAAHTFTRSEKCLAVASYLKQKGAKSSTLAIWARDRIRSSYLPPGRFRYHSAGLEGQHDYRLDLERPRSFPDQAFDCSVCLQRRWSFPKRGSLSTDKYALLPDHQGDRHRCLTTYRKMEPFIKANARQAGFRISLVIEELVGGPAGRFAMHKDFLQNGRFAEHCTFAVTRDN